MIKKLFSTGSFTLAYIATLLGLNGIEAFETIQIEGVALTTFEFLIYFTVFTTGLYGLLASKETPNLQGLVQVAMTSGKNSIYSVASGILGWLLGLTTYAAYTGSLVDVSMGIFLSVYFTIMALMPIRWSTDVESLSNKKLHKLVVKFKHTKIFILINIVFIILGTYGFIELLGR